MKGKHLARNNLSETDALCSLSSHICLEIFLEFAIKRERISTMTFGVVR